MTSELERAQQQHLEREQAEDRFMKHLDALALQAITLKLSCEEFIDNARFHYRLQRNRLVLKLPPKRALPGQKHREQ